MRNLTAGESQNRIVIDSAGLAVSGGYLKVFNYVADTGEYSGETTEYLMEGIGIPANSTTLSPPEISNGSAAVFINDSWVIKADHRGEKVYSINDGSVVVIESLGEYPTATTVLKPATLYDKWDGEKWVTDVKAQQMADVSAANAQKAALLSNANRLTQSWQAQLQLGIITDDDKEALTLWMRYVQTLQVVDTSKAPDITWPSSPT